MTRLSIKTLALSAVIGIGSVLSAGTAFAAPAANTIVNTGISPSNIIEINHRPGHWGPGYRRACTAGQAVSKARRMGLRNPVVSVRRNVVRVTGWRHGNRTAVVFAKARGCPIVR